VIVGKPSCRERECVIEQSPVAVDLAPLSRVLWELMQIRRTARIKIIRHGFGPDQLDRVAVEHWKNGHACVAQRDERNENEDVGLLLVIDAIVFQQKPRQFAIQAWRKCNENRLLRDIRHYGR
jgi:hypothetical protein